MTASGSLDEFPGASIILAVPSGKKEIIKIQHGPVNENGSRKTQTAGAVCTFLKPGLVNSHDYRRKLCRTLIDRAIMKKSFFP